MMSLSKWGGKPRLEYIVGQLRARLKTMQAGDALITGHELADFYGVSYSTIRRATDILKNEGLIRKIPGSGSYVAEIAGIVEPGTMVELPGTVVYADPWAVKGNAYFTRCLQGIVEAAGEHGLRLRVFKMRSEQAGDLLSLLAQPDVRGLLAPWLHAHVLDWIRLERPELRVVTLGMRFPTPGFSSVMLDYPAMAYQGCCYLFNDLGVANPALVIANHNTLAGTASFSEERPECRFRIIRTVPEVQDTAALRARIMDAQPDAFFFDDDRVAAACLSLLPESLPVIAMANAGEDILPTRVARLTTDSFEVGAGAVSLLCRMLKESRAIPVTTLVQPHLELPFTH